MGVDQQNILNQHKKYRRYLKSYCHYPTFYFLLFSCFLCKEEKVGNFSVDRISQEKLISWTLLLRSVVYKLEKMIPKFFFKIATFDTIFNVWRNYNFCKISDNIDALIYARFNTSFVDHDTLLWKIWIREIWIRIRNFFCIWNIFYTDDL